MLLYQSLQYHLWCLSHQQEVGNVKTIGFLFFRSIVFKNVAYDNPFAN